MEAQRQQSQEMEFSHPEASATAEAAPAQADPASEAGHTPFVRQQPKVGRNEPCPCGSGKKYKHCHGKLN